MFRGASAINMDAKGRIAIPARYRDALRVEHAGTVIMTVDIDAACLLIYPLHEWEQIEAKLRLLSDTDPLERSFKRKLLGHAQDCELDSHGRIVIPPALRSFASLEKKTMLVGLLNKFELWEESAWQQQMDDGNTLIQSQDLASNERLAHFSL
ncbi:division/cell wall cluster transcriptional repressor MraZ [Shewanella sp. SR43-4]|uniref:Transcriptional regulator MraZ n=1 Tax=Shewanella vesiculosa TaxID=518738 RepID=A0ABV0FTC7_9GAMM|nr:MULTISPECIES: division/cell wall cluster transcriptional repressor MraZ [Shewanella]MBB1319624.1 division/cell wall cluster transcriptional repressor MraZ [Shewanella sp. SR43-4]MBB1322635.1 division/cell wall cluster transcriptional repressor MraZ [Shewanella sp. SR43-8]RPA35413.1 transcriptional regulator MraZ [Shewanella vesiculosa]UJL42204.1 division/cell wall cluster transcriptional repressor MraZ [Shewanella vesiculosa]